jgi:hypothetical protein
MNAMKKYASVSVIHMMMKEWNLVIVSTVLVPVVIQRINMQKYQHLKRHHPKVNKT